MAIAFDGANVWIANQNSNNVTELRASDGATMGTFQVGAGPNGIAFDGSNLWVVNGGDNTLTKLSSSNGSTLGSFPLTGSMRARGIAFDGTNIWVGSGSLTSTVTKVRPADGSILGTLAVGSAPYGIAFDGANVWVVNSNSSTVSRL